MLLLRNNALWSKHFGLDKGKYLEVHSKQVVPRKTEAKFSKRRPLAGKDKNGGGGIRTPVPRCFKISVYMLIRLSVFSPYQAPSDRRSVRLFR